MSAIFSKRGRRQNTAAADDSYADLVAPPPIQEKRTPSPFSYLRLRKRSMQGKKAHKADPAIRRYGSAESLYSPEIKPLPPVPLLPNHNRGSSGPELIYGALVYPRVRSPTSSDSSVSIVAPQAPPRQFAPQWDTPPSEEAIDILTNAHSLVPKPPPMLAAAAVISSHSHRGMGPHHSGGKAKSITAPVQMDKPKVAATVGPLITLGMQNLTKAQTVLEEVVASEEWSVMKENVTVVLAPAKDLVQILDSVTKYIPALMVAESILAVIVKHELDRHENDKNIVIVYHTMSVFLFTLCDLQTIFRAAECIDSSLKTFFEEVGKTMQDFGNFRQVYYRHGHFVRTLRSSEYRKKLEDFSQKFVQHKADLQFILTEEAAVQINDVSTGVGTVAAKVDALAAMLQKAVSAVAQQTPLEASVAQRIRENGGDEALQNPEFLNELGRSEFGLGAQEELAPQVHASLREGLDEALVANMPRFTLKIEAAQKEMREAVERSTAAILLQLNSGPYQLIHDEDIKAVWKDMNWRISCKARHFVDAVHNHFAQKFGEHQHCRREIHSEQWTLNVLSQVIYYPNISDAIDDDGSGYISVHEVNHFFKSRPKDWSAVQWLAFWAAGWKQNALAYKTQCEALFSDIEASARTVLPQNRRGVKAYLTRSGISELWLIVNSLSADGLAHCATHQAPEMEPLNKLREKIVRKETEHIQSRLERIQYQLDSPETVLAVLGTHRLEGFILCFLELILDRHHKIIDAANTLVLGERELDAMTSSLKNLVAAFSARYHTLTQNWKQQRLDTDFLLQSFAGGIFNDWHEVFQDHPTAHHVEPVETPMSAASRSNEHSRRSRWPTSPEDILVFPIPPQPSPTGTDDGSRGNPPRKRVVYASHHVSASR
ncbi:hypothetical protein B0H17DRAFT_512489 [Mycena rosella]|uniref:EF-hand domain-containing protein n=1 Tax=Mycena rosella TaxID=1033263 RepID=A0AAD7DJI0_MYCRO|nr:hypothetical protein B0H17DRAFT_512489 [Mycena rosella]